MVDYMIDAKEELGFLVLLSEKVVRGYPSNLCAVIPQDSYLNNNELNSSLLLNTADLLNPESTSTTRLKRWLEADNKKGWISLS